MTEAQRRANKRYYKKNREEILAKQKDYNKKNSDNISSYSLIYRRKNKVYYREYSTKHEKTNKRSEYRKEYRKKNKEAILKYQKEHYEINRDIIALRKKYWRYKNIALSLENNVLWLRFRKFTTQKISTEIGVSRATVENVLRAFYSRTDEKTKFVLDSIHSYNLKKEKISLDRILDYHLGIFWSIGSYSDETKQFIFVHRERYFLEQIELYFDSRIYAQEARTAIQYVLKTALLNVDALKKIGWTERNAEQRNVPLLNNYRNFLRAYFELHSSLDYCTSYNRKREKYYRLRLRVYGNEKLIISINNILHMNVETGLKALQLTKNNKTAIITYASYKEIQSIYNWLTGTPCNINFWENVDKLMQKPILTEYEKMQKNEV